MGFLLEQMVSCFLLEMLCFTHLLEYPYVYEQVDDICMQHTCTHTFLQSFFCKHQSCAKLSNLSSSNLNSSCWIEILVEQMVFLEAKNTSADRCFRRKLKLNFLGGSSFRGFWSWLWLFLLYSTCCKCCLFPKKKYYRL